MVTSAQLRAARAYLGWTMEEAAMACGLHRRTIIRLENDERYAKGQPASLGSWLPSTGSGGSSWKTAASPWRIRLPSQPLHLP